MRNAFVPNQDAIARRRSSIVATCVALLVGVGQIGWFATLFLALR